MSETQEKKDFSRRPQLPPEIVRKPSPDTATSVAVANHQQRPEATADADALRELSCRRNHAGGERCRDGDGSLHRRRLHRTLL